MLIKVKSHGQKVNVYLDCRVGNLLDRAYIADRSYIHIQVTRFVTALIEKLYKIYGKKGE